MDSRSSSTLIKEILEEYKAVLMAENSPNGRLEQALEQLDKIVQDEKKLCIDTPLGTLVAYTSADVDYPGIYIDLHREDSQSDAPVVLVEYTETEGNVAEGGFLISRIWKDVAMEEYSYRIIHEKVDDFFEFPEKLI